MGSKKNILGLLTLFLLVAALPISLYLVQQKTNLLPKAFSPGVQPPQISPSTGLALLAMPKTQILDNQSEENVTKEGSVNIFEGMGTVTTKPVGTVRLSYYPGEEIIVRLYATSDIDEANLFTTKIKFDKDILEVASINVERSFIQNWVEQNYDNSLGTISLTGGMPAPGYKTTPGNPAFMGIIVFKGKTIGTANISFTDESAIFRNSDNQNILQIKVDSTINIVKKEDVVCATIITFATDPASGVCKSFPTPCEVPKGWNRVDGCPVVSCSPPPPPPSGCNYIYGDPDPKDPNRCPAYKLVCNQKKGDGNSDGKVDLVDMSVLLTDFNKEQGFREPIDMLEDGKINTFDFSLHRKMLIDLKVIKGQ